MRRALFLAVLLVCPVAFTQDSATALAEREEARERYKRMSAKIEDLENAIQTYNQQFQRMEAEINRLQSEVSRLRESSRDSGGKADLAEQIRAVDRARLADQENVKKGFAELRKELLGTLAKAPKSNSPPTPQATEKGLEYEIREGDTLSKLVMALNKQGVKVTQKQIEQANPGVNWTRLKIGQKIFIPATSG